jgi:hypothetical protein
MSAEASRSMSAEASRSMRLIVEYLALEREPLGERGSVYNVGMVLIFGKDT